MSCQCQGIRDEFDDSVARRELRFLRWFGPRRTTRQLIEAVSRGGVRGRTAVDIGGGVGAIQFALCEAGVERVTSVDASPAYLDTARIEASDRGYSGQIEFVYGDFVDRAADVPASDIVTLDRVLCCYHDVSSLVRLSAEKARLVYGVVYPRVNPLTRIVFGSLNVLMRFRKSCFRGFLHKPDHVERLLSEAGFQRAFLKKGVLWQVATYERQ